MSEITIRGRIATVHLPAGAETTVEHTAAIDALIAQGFAEEVRDPAAPRPRGKRTRRG